MLANLRGALASDVGSRGSGEGWKVFGLSRGLLEASSGHLGGIWAAAGGVVWEVCWGSRGLSWLLRGSWGQLKLPLWGYSWGFLEVCWAVLEPSWGPLGVFVGASWAILSALRPPNRQETKTMQHLEDIVDLCFWVPSWGFSWRPLRKSRGPAGPY